MHCLSCGHRIQNNFSKFCDECGDELSGQRIIEKKSPKKLAIHSTTIEEDLSKVSHIFAICVTSFIVASIFFLIYLNYIHNLILPIAAFVSVLFVWMILLFVLQDLAERIGVPSLKFVLMPLIFPIVGTFFSYLYLINKAYEKNCQNF
jgi:glucan phosphoethanolaminetransferase (alkaline phosphatase superfamily)